MLWGGFVLNSFCLLLSKYTKEKIWWRYKLYCQQTGWPCIALTKATNRTADNLHKLSITIVPQKRQKKTVMLTFFCGNRQDHGESWNDQMTFMVKHYFPTSPSTSLLFSSLLFNNGNAKSIQGIFLKKQNQQYLRIK